MGIGSANPLRPLGAALLCAAGVWAAVPVPVRPKTVAARPRVTVKKNPALAGLPKQPAWLTYQLLEAPPPPVPGTCVSCSAPLLSTAYSLLGIRYRRGGTTPEYGFDCSGFTRYVYQSNFEITLPTSAPAQFHVGIPVSRAELLPGDLVFFRHRQRGWHVGLYAGDGNFIHAPNVRRTVSVSSLNSPYFKATYVGARRIPLEGVTPTGAAFSGY